MGKYQSKVDTTGVLPLFDESATTARFCMNGKFVTVGINRVLRLVSEKSTLIVLISVARGGVFDSEPLFGLARRCWEQGIPLLLLPNEAQLGAFCFTSVRAEDEGELRWLQELALSKQRQLLDRYASSKYAEVDAVCFCIER